MLFLFAALLALQWEAKGGQLVSLDGLSPRGRGTPR